MYLYYYLNEKYVGRVDIEVMQSSKRDHSLVITDDEGQALIGALELMYGKRIDSFTADQAYTLRTASNKTSLPSDIYTTSNVGPVLRWGSQERSLLCD